MPGEAVWREFYDADGIVEALGCARLGTEHVAEFGCG